MKKPARLITWMVPVLLNVRIQNYCDALSMLSRIPSSFSQANILYEGLFDELGELLLLAFVLGWNELAQFLGAAKEATSNGLELVRRLLCRLKILQTGSLLLKRSQEMHLPLCIYNSDDQGGIAQQLNGILLFQGPKNAQWIRRGLQLLYDTLVDWSLVDRKREHARAHVVLVSRLVCIGLERLHQGYKSETVGLKLVFLWQPDANLEEEAHAGLRWREAHDEGVSLGELERPIVPIIIWLRKHKSILRFFLTLLIVVRSRWRDTREYSEEAFDLVIVNRLDIDPDSESWFVLRIVCQIDLRCVCSMFKLLYIVDYFVHVHAHGLAQHLGYLWYRRIWSQSSQRHDLSFVLRDRVVLRAVDALRVLRRLQVGSLLLLWCQIGGPDGQASLLVLWCFDHSEQYRSCRHSLQVDELFIIERLLLLRLRVEYRHLVAAC